MLEHSAESELQHIESILGTQVRGCPDFGILLE